MSRDFCRFLRAGAAVLLVTTAAPAVFGVAVPEPKLKAAYLHRLAEVATWPSDVFAEAGSPFVIGFVEPSPSSIAKFLDEQARKGLRVQDRPIRVERILPDSTEEGRRDRLEAALRKCHLLFISRDLASDWDEIRDLVRELPVMTVSDMPGFAESGGHVELTLTSRGSLDFRVNLVSSQRNGLKLSSRFLSLSSVRIVGKTSRVPAEKTETFGAR